MNDKRLWLLIALAVWLCIAPVACGGTRPTPAAARPTPTAAKATETPLPEAPPKVPEDIDAELGDIHPPTPQPESVTLLLAVGGGPFGDSTVQHAVVAALDRWRWGMFSGGTVTLLLSDQGQVSDVTAEAQGDPDLARELLAEAGYPDGFAAVFIYSDGDMEVARAARVMAEDLEQASISTELLPVSPTDIFSVFDVRAAAGESVMLLVRQ